MTDEGMIVDIEEIGTFSSGPKVMGLIGPSGSGKTTLMEKIAGLQNHVHGTIKLGNRTLLDSDKGINIPAEKRSIGFLFQDHLLFPHMTVSENIDFPLKLGAARLNTIDTIIKELKLTSLMDKYPHQISGGEKQRVCLARAIISQPELIILDEPTTGLDPLLRENVLKLLQQLIKYIECPIILITHFIDDVIQLCDKLTVMSDGAIVACGPLSDILSQPDIQPFLGYREILTEIEGQISRDDDDILKLQAGSAVIRLENDHQTARRRRIRIRARDVALALKKPDATSLQNIIAGQIDAIEDHGPHEVLVSVRLGDDKEGPILKALITKRSKKDLRLTTDLPVFVMIKAVAVQNPS